jgi:LysM repeat protein
MCGHILGRPDEAAAEKPSAAPVAAKPKPPRKPVLPALNITLPGGTATSAKRRKSYALWLLVGVIGLFTLIASFLILRDSDGRVILALAPTFTPIAPGPTLTPTYTPPPTETLAPTETPTFTPTPAPTDTPQPPRFHSVAGGETMFGLSLFYRVSPGSIAEANGVALDAPIQVGQQLSIPWPTATPPLESLILEVKGEKVVADVTDCEIVTLQEGDSAYGLSAQSGVPAEAIIAVNRLTEESIQLLHPGDTLCIPRVAPGDVLPATPGPKPTVTSTAFPAGPALLYPINQALIEPADGVLTLQWAAVKDLAADEWYMVEVTDLDAQDSLPLRAFTRDTSLRVPASWRPVVAEEHALRWRVSIVQKTGERSDGQFIYDYGGQSSGDVIFIWLGAEPTPTPRPTATPTMTPVP